MAFAGNIFTHYNYRTTDITTATTDNRRVISSNRSAFKIEIEETDEPVSLPPRSPFAEWKEARRFAGPLPFTFTYQEHNNSVLIIESVRQNWKPEPIKVLEHSIAFLDELALEGVVLANAFEIRDIPYYWKKGKKEIWQG